MSGGLAMPPGWSVAAAAPEEVAELEREWTGIDRTAEHRLWSGWPDGAAVVASFDGQAGSRGNDRRGRT